MSEKNTSFELDTSLAFDKDKQAAILAWCIYDAQFAEHAARVIKPEWFSSPYVRLLYQVFLNLFEEFGKAPTALELLAHPKIQNTSDSHRYRETFTSAAKLTESYRLPLLRKEMDSWLSAVTFYQAYERASSLYNSHQVDKAWDVLDDAALYRASTRFNKGTNVGFRPSAERMLEERDVRLADVKKHLPYGIGYLRDALGVISPRELVLVGAGPGVGKTQMVTKLAQVVAQQGYPIDYFALEGEEFEIERRIKYGILADAYYRSLARDPEKPKEHICYSWWYHGAVDHVLGPLEKDKEIQENLVQAVQNMNVLYRAGGQFDAKVLQKQLIKRVQKSRLVIIDHLHYVDTDDRSDENRGYKEVVKVIRDIILEYGVPVFLVAHLRKGDRRSPVIASLDDFMGTSDIGKIATTAILLGRAFDRVAPENEPWLKPTYINIPKCRLEGERTWYTACGYFNPRINDYQDGYVLGQMSQDRSSWSPLEQSDIPFWASNAYIPNRY